jgi:hypothetical protein
MFKISGTVSYNLCFSQLLIWHILWLKSGSSDPCFMILTALADDVYDVSGDVETSDSGAQIRTNYTITR